MSDAKAPTKTAASATPASSVAKVPPTNSKEADQQSSSSSSAKGSAPQQPQQPFPYPPQYYYPYPYPYPPYYQQPPPTGDAASSAAASSKDQSQKTQPPPQPYPPPPPYPFYGYPPPPGTVPGTNDSSKNGKTTDVASGPKPTTASAAKPSDASNPKPSPATSSSKHPPPASVQNSSNSNKKPKVTSSSFSPSTTQNNHGAETATAKIPVTMNALEKEAFLKQKETKRFMNERNALIWKKSSNNATTQKVIHYEKDQTVSKPVSSQVPSRQQACKSTQVFHIEDGGHSHIIGYLDVPPGSATREESSGNAVLTFMVQRGEDGLIEASYAHPNKANAMYDEKTAQRYYLGSGDMFYVPQFTRYRIKNYSTRHECKLHWTLSGKIVDNCSSSTSTNANKNNNNNGNKSEARVVADVVVNDNGNGPSAGSDNEGSIEEKKE